MKKLKLTPWYPADVKPVRKGVYDTQSQGGDGYAYWDGRHWFPFKSTASTALKRGTELSDLGIAEYQGKQWRGVAYDPKGGAA